jgi:imidazolonepropionase-like amidohydrolase
MNSFYLATRNLLLIFGLIFLSNPFYGQSYLPERETSNPETYYTAVKAKSIFVTPDNEIKNGILLFKEGKIVEVGANLKLPENTRIINYADKVIYPGFIELYSNYGTESVQPKRKETKDKHSEEVNYWNLAVRPETNPIQFFKQDPKNSLAFNKNGFTHAQIFVPDGIFRGATALVRIDSLLSARESLVKNQNAWAMSFKRGKTGASYPSSLMGAIALIKQFYHDADYCEQVLNCDLGIDVFLQNKDLPAFFEVTDLWDVLRAEKIEKDFNKQYHYFLSGTEYERLDVLKEISKKSGLIFPLNFPEAYDIQGPYESDEVSLQQLMRWYQHPFAPKMMHEAGIGFALTQKGLKKQTEFLKNLRKSVNLGFPEKEALRALTETPAKLLGAAHIGNLNPGSEASFIIASEDFFTDDKANIYAVFVKGKSKTLKVEPSAPAGMYSLNVNGQVFELKVEEKNGKISAEIKSDSLKAKVNILLEDFVASLSFINPKDSLMYSLSGQLYAGGTIWEGFGFSQKDKKISWAALKDNKTEKDKKSKNDSLKVEPISIPTLFPNKAYGLKNPMKENNVLIKNATIWTCDKDSILTETDILVLNGKITRIGKKIPEPFEKGNPIPLKVIDAKGKVVTPGIIDEHSHIAISRGVNEGSQYISAEVSIADVVNPEDINIYRQLAGGVTGAQLLHGSANPIGGKSALVKLKWGVSAEEMLIPNAPGYIKFALGENVKQSNWGDRGNPRYPQTRMGVEQVYFDAFYRARAYRDQKTIFENQKNKRKKDIEAFRTDLELETLVEILEGKRHISCHSYVQSEINMLMRVADSMGFKVQTFTHILEGYKIPERLKAHGANASTFSDWWAYKFEVNDAIPYNATILALAGVNTCINSDDAEMGRRLYMEAAKSQVYGGLDPYEAFKMVTINPAKALKIDHLTGSIALGKDADLVIWSHAPNSIYTQVEKTFVEGVNYYSLNQNKELQQQNEVLRNQLIALMLAEINKGAKAIPVKRQLELHIHCDHIEFYE